MEIAVFSTMPYDRDSLGVAFPPGRHALRFLDERLHAGTPGLASGCVFVNDTLDTDCLEQLGEIGVQLVVLRCAGFNNVDLAAAEGLGIEVYEEEEALFFADRSCEPIPDDQFVRLLTFPNVLITGHQGFFTVEAITEIASTTRRNVDNYAEDGRCRNRLTPQSP